MSAESMREASATGQSQRCTDSGAPSSKERTRFWYSSSARNGVNGAMRRASVVSASYSVA